MTVIFLSLPEREGRAEGVFAGCPCLTLAAFRRSLRPFAPRLRPPHPGPLPEGEGEVVLSQ